MTPQTQQWLAQLEAKGRHQFVEVADHPGHHFIGDARNGFQLRGGQFAPLPRGELTQ